MNYVLSWTVTFTFHHDFPFIQLHYTYVTFISSPCFTSSSLLLVTFRFFLQNFIFYFDMWLTVTLIVAEVPSGPSRIRNDLNNGTIEYNSVSGSKRKASYVLYWRPPLWSSGQEFLVIDPEVRVRFPALPDFMRSSEPETRSTRPHECNWGATWKKR
jgi:hypothetical protein